MNEVEKLLLEEILALAGEIEGGKRQADIQERFKRIKDLYQRVMVKEHLWSILDEMCEGVPDIQILLLEYLYSSVDEEEILKKEYEVLTRAVQKRQVDLFYANFFKWQFIRRIFMQYETKGMFIERSLLHAELVNYMREFLGMELEPIPKGERDEERILVVCTQLLGVTHGPTRNALDYCCTLQKKLKKQTFLLVAAEMPVKEEALAYASNGIAYDFFNYAKDYEGEFIIEYMGEKIRGYQCRIISSEKERTLDIIRQIYEWRPYLIYNIGSENLVADLCGTFTDEVCVPCGNVYPVTEAKYHIVTRKIEKRDKEILDFLHERNQKVLESIFVYKLEEPKRRYRKGDFGIAESAYVIAIVGTRLDLEVKKPFISTLRTILEMEPNIYFVFFGYFDNFEEVRELIGHCERVLFAGHQSDLRGALNIAELYLNPPRRGGGTSASEALAERIPVITLGDCDVAYTCGEDFLVNSLEDMPGLILKYKHDEEFCCRQKEKAYQQMQKIVDTEGVLREVLRQIE